MHQVCVCGSRKLRQHSLSWRACVLYYLWEKGYFLCLREGLVESGISHPFSYRTKLFSYRLVHAARFIVPHSSVQLPCVLPSVVLVLSGRIVPASRMGCRERDDGGDHALQT
ncbi:unnamed protein product [Ectocarpus fasciculatus]